MKRLPPLPTALAVLTVLAVLGACGPKFRPGSLEPEGGYPPSIVDERPLVQQITGLDVEPSPGGVIIRAQGLPPTGSADKPLTAFFRETWTTRQGLPHNQVNAIAQAPDGYLWFATWEGLVRYNGLEFHVFDRRNTPGLKDNGIRSVHATPDGTIVVGTSRGGVSVARYPERRVKGALLRVLVA